MPRLLPSPSCPPPPLPADSLPHLERYNASQVSQACSRTGVSTLPREARSSVGNELPPLDDGDASADDDTVPRALRRGRGGGVLRGVGNGWHGCRFCPDSFTC